MSQPLVSIRLVAYNHENYIAQCLEGILMQRTDFPFEVIIGEDCSKDRTRAILVAYAEKFPGKFHLLLHEHNLGAAGNNQSVIQACRGKYHAMLEGDDYWIDPLKLQKQVDFLEAHPDYSLCFHNAFILSPEKAAARLYFEKTIQSGLEFDEVCDLHTPTASVMARSEILATLPEWRTQVWCSDVVMRLWCAHHGKLGYLSDIMAVYRVHRGGMIAANRTRLAKSLAEEKFLYRELDKDTNYQHTAVLQAKVRQVEERYRRSMGGKWFYLTHPGQISRRLREYVRALKRGAALKDFGMS